MEIIGLGVRRHWARSVHGTPSRSPFIIGHGEALQIRQHTHHQLGLRHINPNEHRRVRATGERRPRPSW